MNTIPPVNGDVPSKDAANFRSTKAVATEMEASEDVKPRASTDDTGVPGLKVMQGLVTATFFSDLFCHQACKRFTHPGEEDRVAAFIREHKTYYRICRYSDFLYRAVAATALLGALVTIAVGGIIKVFFH